jgi:hypothetical protein
MLLFPVEFTFLPVFEGSCICGLRLQRCGFPYLDTSGFNVEDHPHSGSSMSIRVQCGALDMVGNCTCLVAAGTQNQAFIALL